MCKTGAYKTMLLARIQIVFSAELNPSYGASSCHQNSVCINQHSKNKIKIYLIRLTENIENIRRMSRDRKVLVVYKYLFSLQGNKIIILLSFLNSKILQK